MAYDKSDQQNQDELEIEILSHAVSSNYSLLNLVKATQEDEIEDEAEIEGKLEVEFDISNSLSERNQFDPLEFKAYSLEKEVNSSSETPKKAFSSWLKSNVNDIPLEREEDSKSKVDQLVNQFIKTEPTITRPEKEILEEEKPKAEFFSPVKKAKQSLDENSLPVSETLAKIFVAQGNFPKAIYAYEQLMVIYPEKKIFFAKQIEELTKKINT